MWTIIQQIFAAVDDEIEIDPTTAIMWTIFQQIFVAAFAVHAVDDKIPVPPVYLPLIDYVLVHVLISLVSVLVLNCFGFSEDKELVVILTIGFLVWAVGTHPLIIRTGSVTVTLKSLGDAVESQDLRKVATQAKVEEWVRLSLATIRGAGRNGVNVNGLMNIMQGESQCQSRGNIPDDVMNRVVKQVESTAQITTRGQNNGRTWVWIGELE